MTYNPFRDGAPANVDLADVAMPVEARTALMAQGARAGAVAEERGGQLHVTPPLARALREAVAQADRKAAQRVAACEKRLIDVLHKVVDRLEVVEKSAGAPLTRSPEARSLEAQLDQIAGLRSPESEA